MSDTVTRIRRQAAGTMAGDRLRLYKRLCVYIYIYIYIYIFIHSFIHSEDLYSASSRDYYFESVCVRARACVLYTYLCVCIYTYKYLLICLLERSSPMSLADEQCVCGDVS